MSLIIDNGLVLSNTTTTDRNTINSNGNDLEITSNNGNIKFQTTGNVVMLKNLNLGAGGGGGELTNVSELRSRTVSSLALNAVSASLIFKTNNTNQLTISSAGTITFTNQPIMNVATSSTTTNQLLSMNNFMTSITFTPSVFTSLGTGVIDNVNSYGRYSRFGNIVFIIYNIVMTDASPLGAADLRISLPITPSQFSSLNISKLNNFVYTGSITSSFDMYPTISASVNYFTIDAINTAVSSSTVTIKGTNFGNSTEISMTGFYFV
jgi:hypothetical protein